MWQNKKPYILIFPAMFTLGILFFGGLFNGVIESLDTSQGFSTILLSRYREILKSKEFWTSFNLTFRIALLSTVISVLMATMIILFLFILGNGRNGRKSIVLQRLLQIPMLFPFLVSAYLIFLLLTQGGFVSRIFFNLGLTQDITQFPILVNDRFGWGIIFSYVWKTSPFAILMLCPVLLKVGEGWIDVGRIFGASKFHFFRQIVFPLLLKPLKLVSYIIFSFTFLDFEIPFILGITYPKTLSVQSYEIYTAGSFVDRPKAFAINVLSMSFIILIGLGCGLFSKFRLHLKERKIGEN